MDETEYVEIPDGDSAEQIINRTRGLLKNLVGVSPNVSVTDWIRDLRVAISASATNQGELLTLAEKMLAKERYVSSLRAELKTATDDKVVFRLSEDVAKAFDELLQVTAERYLEVQEVSLTMRPFSDFIIQRH